MVTIAILAIIVGIAAPSISTQLANQRVKSTAATISSALKEAKAESIIRREDITITYNDAVSPNTITLTDSDGNDIYQYRLEASSNIIETITPSGITNLTFQPNKILEDGAEASYVICDTGSDSEQGMQISINSIANITIDTGSC